MKRKTKQAQSIQDTVPCFPVGDYEFAEQQKVLITGGAGFVGTNLAHQLLCEGHQVIIFDNLSRQGVLNNLLWLQKMHPHNLQIMIADIRNTHQVQQAVEGVDAIFHLAAQVAVTTSFATPEEDFAINIQGTFNLLNAARKQTKPPAFLFTSTNKVYGGLQHLTFHPNGTRYLPNEDFIKKTGIDESSLLDFHSPYGCSKGAADQYVKDFARSFGIPTVVFRMSCIYGPHQCGTEDQGWVAHFLISALQGKPIHIYGDGKQVRDILYVTDLVNAFQLAWRNIHQLAGEAYNIGGGPQNSVSLLELITLLEHYLPQKVQVSFDNWRPGDQRYYVSNIKKFEQATGWQPRVSANKGIQLLLQWLEQHYLQRNTTALTNNQFLRQTT
ncbi:MAG: GDP-mannose 4,6-dehydratase [Saprospiraceae bacterium]